MSTPELGRLTIVPPRQVWPHEALNFTPWLLQNVDVLGDLLGMDLELEVAEHPVGDFSLDLIGRDLSDDSVVIVENQLEASDHGHLGQILTYAAGTDPKTIVWVTTRFRPEHRAALDWLNEHTDPDTRFFGVEIVVVKIGDSDPAPNFVLAAQPNEWGKQVKAATAASGTSEKSQRYWNFWESFLNTLTDRHPTWTNRKTSSRDNFYDLSTGTGGVVFAITFANDGLRLQLYFNGAAEVNLSRFLALRSKKEQFELALGEAAEWDEKPGLKSAAIYVPSPFNDVANVEQWSAMIDWLIDQLARFRRAIDAVGGLVGLRRLSVSTQILPLWQRLARCGPVF